MSLLLVVPLHMPSVSIKWIFTKKWRYLEGKKKKEIV